MRRAPSFLLAMPALLIAASAAFGAARPSGPIAPAPELKPGRRDPLVAMVRRVDRFLWKNAVGGVTPDSRWVLNPTETARLTATCQLLGYAELNTVVPRHRFRTTVQQCADTLLARFAEVRSGTVFDGMLGYAMLKAYETIGDPRYLAAAEDIIAELTAIPRTEYILNGGLMAAMAFAEHYHVTGSTDSESLARYVIAGEPAYQHADGCFPHWCWCTRDISYTDWMSMELILIQRVMDDPHIDPILAGTLSFMEGRIDAQGHTSYEEPCPGEAGCTIPCWSLGSGCSIDTETRAFTNEPAYSALLFDHFHSPRYGPVLGFLQSIEQDGTWADQWDFFVPPTDPYYPWASADTSVINISIDFWALAAILSGRSDAQAIRLDWASAEEMDDFETVYADPTAPRLRVPAAARAVTAPPVSRMRIAPSGIVATCDSPGLTPATGASPAPMTPALAFAAITPNPSRAAFEIRFTSAAGGDLSLTIVDAAGRRVRDLVSRMLPSGPHAATWDGRDDAGRPCGDGVYFAVLRRGDDLEVRRLQRIQ